MIDAYCGLCVTKSAQKMELSKKNSKFLKKKSIKKLCNLVRRRDFRQVQKCFFFSQNLDRKSDLSESTANPSSAP